MRRAFATFLVVWIIAVAGVIVAQIQDASYRQAASGRERMATVRAAWAARAGIEATIARLGYNTEKPDESDAYRVIDDMEEVAIGELDGADWYIAHEVEGNVLPGPADAHAKMNVSLMNTAALMVIPFMTEDVAESIQDWVDGDDDPRIIGAEVSYYARADFAYEPRNAPMRSITELELVAGTDPVIVRGEDWDLDGQLDADEKDGGITWPDDNADQVLDASWSAHLTGASWHGTIYADSGEERLDLTLAGESDITSRLGVDSDQATVILSLAQTPGVTHQLFLAQPLSALVNAIPEGLDRPDGPVADLEPQQLALLLGETTFGVPVLQPGKLNLNTAADETLEYVPGMSLDYADAIRYDRADRSSGYTSLVDLLEILPAEAVASLYPYVDVRSNVYIVSSHGRDRATGLEVQIVATIDRSTLPVAIREITIR